VGCVTQQIWVEGFSQGGGLRSLHSRGVSRSKGCDHTPRHYLPCWICWIRHQDLYECRIHAASRHVWPQLCSAGDVTMFSNTRLGNLHLAAPHRHPMDVSCHTAYAAVLMQSLMQNISRRWEAAASVHVPAIGCDACIIRDAHHTSVCVLWGQHACAWWLRSITVMNRCRQRRPRVLVIFSESFCRLGVICCQL
jgi:hypothetical protein